MGCMTTQSAGKELDLGPTGRVVARQLAHIRKQQGLTYVELSKKLEALGAPIPTLGLRRIEARARRVSADDLVALAAALGVSPHALLVDPYDSETLPTGVSGDVTTEEAQAWIGGQTGLSVESRIDFHLSVHQRLTGERVDVEKLLESSNTKAARWAQHRLKVIDERLQQAERRLAELRLRKDADSDAYLVDAWNHQPIIDDEDPHAST